jgi:fructose-specific phosphotransferase system IIC component
MSFTDFSDLLAWLAGTGSAIVAGMAIAFILRWYKTWNDLLPENTKKLIVSFLTAIIAAAAVWLQGQPDIIASIEPYYKWLMLSITLFTGTQVAYFLTKIGTAPSK